MEKTYPEQLVSDHRIKRGVPYSKSASCAHRPSGQTEGLGRKTYEAAQHWAPVPGGKRKSFAEVLPGLMPNAH